MDFRKSISLVGCVLSFFTMAGLIIMFVLVIGYRAIAHSQSTPTPTKTPRPTVVATSTPTPVILAMAVETPVTSPTLVPSLAAYIPTPTSGLTAAFTPSPISTLTNTPLPIPEAPLTLGTSGWSFVGVRIYTDQYDDSLLLYGDLINNAGASQELWYLTGTFYDAQGQVIADEGSAYGYWPVEVIPPGGHVPFELIVEGIQSAAGFDLSVEAQPSSATPRQDFEFSDLYQLDEGYGYCIGGTLRNPGSKLQDYLTVVAVLYDGQDKVISFGEYYADPEYVVGDQTEEFEVCVDPHDQDVARYELRAWGQ